MVVTWYWHVSYWICFNLSWFQSFVCKVSFAFHPLVNEHLLSLWRKVCCVGWSQQTRSDVCVVEFNFTLPSEVVSYNFFCIRLLLLGESQRLLLLWYTFPGCRRRIVFQSTWRLWQRIPGAVGSLPFCICMSTFSIQRNIRRYWKGWMPRLCFMLYAPMTYYSVNM